MVLLHTARVVFIHVQRTGGTTITNLIKQQFGKNLDLLEQHANYSSSQGKVLEKYWDYKAVGMVRNPWHRMASWYHLVHQNNSLPLQQEQERFYEFLNASLPTNNPDPYFNFNQLDYFPPINAKDQRVFMLPYESFTQSTHKIFALMGCTPPEHIPKMNTSQNKEFGRLYTPKSKAFIEDHCSKDIAFFGYKFE